MNRSIHQEFNVSFEYKILFTKDIFSLENSLFANTLQIDDSNVNVLIVIDQGVYNAHQKIKSKIKEYLKFNFPDNNLCYSFYIVEGGEAAKNEMKYIDAILERINSENIDRHSYIIAIGGGAVLDMAGFAASIGHRGIRLIRVPTTVLSQNDSGVGVKTSINYFNKKNFVGTFQTPYAVINDSNFLSTLTDKDWRSGISEAIKVALIKDTVFFDWIEENAQNLKNRDSQAMEYLIYRCAQLHAEHISSYGDPFEQDSSRPLDFGHWSAHKLESMSNYQITHGEAVAYGIILDSCYSFIVNLISEKDFHRILDCFLKIGFESGIDNFIEKGFNELSFNKQIIKGLEEFREHLGGKLTIMLLEEIGKGIEVNEIDIDTLNKVAAYFSKIHQEQLP
ncbi:3-dehydroquinate synthase [Aureibacter tunicatorum]|uniref:3-dehydroquinate synthase n=1 Tax=Aureibacter tunicatorum TaxID=866807 RepID=A0AAE4BRW2_9BACT|nr:3-dehydroquinate synthase [Aureibacter tunicatorum]MDR6240594.1 3-dehydroquinate synthase [Aureibacter tunicatorum]BDD06545.1 3-dehydroquinate synthase [Aureibacter tunicatorum]